MVLLVLTEWFKLELSIKEILIVSQQSLCACVGGGVNNTYNTVNPETLY